jgi:uncharacterized protein (TIGR02145 family)
MKRIGITIVGILGLVGLTLFITWDPKSEDTGPETVKDFDGNVYHTVKIGTQTWMVENLKTTHYNDGTAIPLVTDNIMICVEQVPPEIEDDTIATEMDSITDTTSHSSEYVISEWQRLKTPAYCWYENDTDVYNTSYGALYNWYAVHTGKLAPKGWHVPTKADWDTLQNYLISHGYNYDGTTTGNKIAKAMAAKPSWSASSYRGTAGYDILTNNKSGFSALPGGNCADGGFSYQGIYGYWWSTTEYDTSSACYCSLSFNESGFIRDFMEKNYGCSVRLVKD